MDNLKQKTKKSIVWNAIEKVGVQLIALVTGLYVVRNVSESDMGFIGALTIFVTIGLGLVDMGFSTALIRRDSNTDEEYSAIFYVNLMLSLVLYLIGYICAPLISDWYSIPELTALSRFLFLSVIINSLSMVQNVRHTKALDFRCLAISNLVAVVVSGVVAITLVHSGYSYWALAWQQISLRTSKTIMLWVIKPWKGLKLNPNFGVVKELFGFSYLLIINGIVSSVASNFFTVTIGRVFPASILGHYYTADKYKNIAKDVITPTITQVAMPVLTEIKEDKDRQKQYYRKFMNVCALLIFPALLGLAVVFDDFCVLVLTEKWLPIVPYFRILVAVALLDPFNGLANQILLVEGKTGQFFFSECVRHVLLISSAYLCFLTLTDSQTTFLEMFGGNAVINLMIVASFVAWFICLGLKIKYLNGIFRYSISEMVKDVFPYLMLSVVMLTVVWYAKVCMEIGPLLRLVTSIVVGGIVYFMGLKLYKCDILDELSILKKKDK